MGSEELGVGEELVERVIYPDGRVEERIVRRVAYTTVQPHEFPQAPPQVPEPPDLTPPPQMVGVYWGWNSLETIDVLAELLAAGPQNRRPWGVTGAAENWIQWRTEHWAYGYAWVMLARSIPGRPATVLEVHTMYGKIGVQWLVNDLTEHLRGCGFQIGDPEPV